MDFLEDLELYERAMDNAYNLITKRKTLDDIYYAFEQNKELDDFFLPFDPTFENGRTPDVIDMVIEHFTKVEAYEKCAELLKIKEECQNSKTQTE